MKVIKQILLLLLITKTLYAIEEDKTLHLQASIVLGYAGETILHKYSQFSHSEKIIFATGIAFAAGVGKELYDEVDYNGFSSKDLVPDFLGSLTGVMLSNYLNKKYFLSVGYKAKDKKSKVSVSHTF